MPLRDYRKKAPGGQRISVWVPDEYAKWKSETLLTWGEIIRAGVQALGSGYKVEFRHGSLLDIERRLNFFIKKTGEMQQQLAAAKDREGKP